MCDEHGILLIADEIQTGFGRTGKMFAIEHSGVAPDLLTTSKSLAGGLPLSAVTGRAEIMDSVEPGGLGGTFGGNPVACAAALAVLEVFEEEVLLSRAPSSGERVMGAMREIQEKHPDFIGDVRGRGAMAAMELVDDPESKTPDKERNGKIIESALQEGLMLLTAGQYGNVHPHPHAAPHRRRRAGGRPLHPRPRRGLGGLKGKAKGAPSRRPLRIGLRRSAETASLRAPVGWPGPI